jgi:hypothetical protein
MDTLVEVEIPIQIKHVVQVVPSHVLLPRCSGLHSGECGSLFYHNQAKKCVGKSKDTSEVKVRLSKSWIGSGCYCYTNKLTNEVWA